MSARTILQGVIEFFNLDNNTSEQDAIQRLNDELESREAEEETGEETADDSDQQEENEQEQSNELAELRQTVERQQQRIEAMQADIKSIKELNAAETTGGKREPQPDQTDFWMNRPIYNDL